MFEGIGAYPGVDPRGPAGRGAVEGAVECSHAGKHHHGGAHVEDGGLGRNGGKVDISVEALRLARGLLESLEDGDEVREKTERKEDHGHHHLTRLILEAATGKKIKVFEPGRGGKAQAMEEHELEETDEADGAEETEDVEVRSSGAYLIHQELYFSASGTVRAGGVERGFTLTLRVTRTFFSTVAGGVEPDEPTAYGGRTAPGGWAAEADASGPVLDLERDGDSFAFRPDGARSAEDVSRDIDDRAGWMDPSSPLLKMLRMFVRGEDGGQVLGGLREAGIESVYLRYTDLRISSDGSAGLVQAASRTTELMISAYSGQTRSGQGPGLVLAA